MLENAGLLLYFFLFGAFLVLFLYAFFERFSVSRFNPRVFGRGWLFYSLAREFSCAPAPVDGQKRVSTESGQFYFLSAAECLFSPRFSKRGFRLRGTLAFKGRMRFSGTSANVEVRAPHGLWMALVVWLIAWPLSVALS